MPIAQAEVQPTRILAYFRRFKAKDAICLMFSSPATSVDVTAALVRAVSRLSRSMDAAWLSMDSNKERCRMRTDAILIPCGRNVFRTLVISKQHVSAS